MRCGEANSLRSRIWNSLLYSLYSDFCVWFVQKSSGQNTGWLVLLHLLCAWSCMEECLSTKQCTRRTPFPHCATSILLLGSVLYYTILLGRTPRKIGRIPTHGACAILQSTRTCRQVFHMQRVVFPPVSLWWSRALNTLNPFYFLALAWLTLLQSFQLGFASAIVCSTQYDTYLFQDNYWFPGSSSCGAHRHGELCGQRMAECRFHQDLLSKRLGAKQQLKRKLPKRCFEHLRLTLLQKLMSIFSGWLWSSLQLFGLILSHSNQSMATSIPVANLPTNPFGCTYLRISASTAQI